MMSDSIPTHSRTDKTLYNLSCDRCGEPIDTNAPKDSDLAPDSVTLLIGSEGMREGIPDNFDLHAKCARSFRREFAAWIHRAKANPPT